MHVPPGFGPCLKRIKSFCFSTVEAKAAKSKYQDVLSKPLPKEEHEPESAWPGTHVPVLKPWGGQAASCLGAAYRAVSLLQQWLVNGGHTADLWQNCTSGTIFHCLTSSTNGECSLAIRDVAACCITLLPRVMESRGICLCRFAVSASCFSLHPPEVVPSHLFPCLLFPVPRWRGRAPPW